jgi:hypothetical protein
MNRKAMIMFGMALGSTAGSSLPMLWGSGWLSLSSVILGLLGGIAGIWAAYKMTQ